MNYCKRNHLQPTDEVKCLCCEHCLPPAERTDGRLCPDELTIKEARAILWEQQMAKREQNRQSAWMGHRKQLYARSIPVTVGDIGRVPLLLTARETDYLRDRFIKNNHPKYHKYCDEWMQGLMFSQLKYFYQEARRLNWEWKGSHGKPRENFE